LSAATSESRRLRETMMASRSEASPGRHVAAPEELARMTPEKLQSATRPRLPVSRSFVVHLADEPCCTLAERVEHVISGRIARFEDVAELAKFFCEVLSGTGQPCVATLGRSGYSADAGTDGEDERARR